MLNHDFNYPRGTHQRERYEAAMEPFNGTRMPSETLFVLLFGILATSAIFLAVTL